jgi:hypothetical protein
VLTRVVLRSKNLVSCLTKVFSRLGNCYPRKKASLRLSNGVAENEIVLSC